MDVLNTRMVDLLANQVSAVSHHDETELPAMVDLLVNQCNAGNG
jgi:hypothetical protein